MDKQNRDKTLRLLDDSVLDLKNSDIMDAFNHKVYADIFAKIFDPMSGNKYGITLALTAGNKADSASASDPQASFPVFRQDI